MFGILDKLVRRIFHTFLKKNIVEVWVSQKVTEKDEPPTSSSKPRYVSSFYKVSFMFQSLRDTMERICVEYLEPNVNVTLSSPT